MVMSTVTSKGQITIPAKIREFLSLNAGDKINFFVQDDGKVVLTAAKSSMLELEGFLPRPKKILSIKQINEAIGKGASKLGNKS